MINLKKSTYLNLVKHDFSLEILVHSNNVANIAIKMADVMKLCHNEKLRLHEEALYHDIGKSKIPESILYKTGRLSTEEWKIMMKHPIYSEELYLSIRNLDEETIKIAQVIRHHHENWDGTGYPDKMAKKRIPLHSRIIKIADMFEAMTQPRIYRPFKIENTLEVMEQLAGKEIDPYIFHKTYPILHKLLENNLQENTMHWKVKSIVGG
ncbi:HD-GYP domain-containing protein [Natronincola ferrireducens]|uniref:HD domain-containing protein n=1 Tax=Natronincola ferrireducens TaxID=393762 RepID=A0A1G8ZD52_9FIRM|nr:HD domain-containing phosphohydrolase [Natronincola ferrireducens]SDK12100.1 HD domain-containing protein [Natronincola ferrireducens]